MEFRGKYIELFMITAGRFKEISQLNLFCNLGQRTERDRGDVIQAEKLRFAVLAGGDEPLLIGKMEPAAHDALAWQPCPVILIPPGLRNLGAPAPQQKMTMLGREDGNAKSVYGHFFRRGC